MALPLLLLQPAPENFAVGICSSLPFLSCVIQNFHDADLEKCLILSLCKTKACLEFAKISLDL